MTPLLAREILRACRERWPVLHWYPARKEIRGRRESVLVVVSEFGAEEEGTGIWTVAVCSSRNAAPIGHTVYVRSLSIPAFLAAVQRVLFSALTLATNSADDLEDIVRARS